MQSGDCLATLGAPGARAGAAARLRAYAQNGTLALQDLCCHILRLQPVAPPLATAAASSVVPISSFSSLSQPRPSTGGGACKRHALASGHGVRAVEAEAVPSSQFQCVANGTPSRALLVASCEW